MKTSSIVVVSAIAVAAGAGCAHHRVVYVRVSEVHSHLPALRQAGHARVDADESDAGLSNGVASEASRNFTVLLDFDRIVDLGDGSHRSLRQLAQDCPDVPPFAGAEIAHPCGLEIHRRESFVFDKTSHWNQDSYSSLSFGLAGLGFAGGAIYCGIECDSSPRAKAIGLAAAALLSWAVAAVYDGARD